jgi:hypothetical protein
MVRRRSGREKKNEESGREDPSDNVSIHIFHRFDRRAFGHSSTVFSHFECSRRIQEFREHDGH